ncbi:MAG TPA: UrcA family protein [Steroidobacteraceae bacterium]|nr:UrcA family protein [Steroidobacteraceae bacterium]
MKTSTTLNLQYFGVLLVLALGSGLAFAGSDALFPPSAVVSYRDLNLTNAEDVAILYGRITRAAEEVCQPAARTGSKLPRPGYHDCVAHAVAVAVAKVNRPELSAYHARREHRGSPAAIAAATRWA